MKRFSHKQKRQFGLLILGLFLAGGIFLLIKFATFLPVFYELFFKKDIQLKKVVTTDPNPRVNVLLLGIGGGKHDGPLLTDTIIFASLDPKTQKTTLVSIPRDLWIPELGGKINKAYSDGETKRKGGGLVLAKAVVEKVIGQPIDYEVRVDFAGFIKAVDMVGGLDINVDNTFDDPEYPLSGKETDDCGFTGDDFLKRATDAAQVEAFPCRYEHLHFDAGPQHMDGETALKFVRSRHASGPEGTDFARSKRQEKVILAFKDKIFSLNTFLNPIKMASLVGVLSDSIDTDITSDDYADFIKLAKKMQHGTITSVVLDYGDASQHKAGLLENPPIGQDPDPDFGYQWVLIPRVGKGDYSEIHSYVSCVITKGNCPIAPLP